MMDEAQLRALFRDELSRTPDSRASCPSPDELQRCATSAGDDGERLATLEHIATCRPCRADFDLMRTAHLAAPAVDEVAPDIRPLEAVAPARSIPRWMPLLAAASLLIVASVARRREPEEVMRGAGTASREFALRSVEGGATDVRLVWSSVPQAVRYRVEVTLEDGSVAFRAETPDTVASGPRTPGTIAHYSVEAVKIDGTTVLTQRTP